MTNEEIREQGKRIGRNEAWREGYSAGLNDGGKAWTAHLSLVMGERIRSFIDFDRLLDKCPHFNSVHGDPISQS